MCIHSSSSVELKTEAESYMQVRTEASDIFLSM